MEAKNNRRREVKTKKKWVDKSSRRKCYQEGFKV
jgi:hypothetical protein